MKNAWRFAREAEAGPHERRATRPTGTAAGDRVLTRAGIAELAALFHPDARARYATGGTAGIEAL